MIEIENITKKKTIKHLTTPEPLKSIYMTQCVAGTPSFREKLVKLVGERELNAVIIDIKDYTGNVLFDSQITLVKDLNLNKNAFTDLAATIQKLHDNNIYVIARQTVFQDTAGRHGPGL